MVYYLIYCSMLEEVQVIWKLVVLKVQILHNWSSDRYFNMEYQTKAFAKTAKLFDIQIEIRLHK